MCLAGQRDARLARARSSQVMQVGTKPILQTRTVLAPKLADMVRAQNLFQRDKRKPILQATLYSELHRTVICKIGFVRFCLKKF
jgi:hypothetical protein